MYGCVALGWVFEEDQLHGRRGSLLVQVQRIDVCPGQRGLLEPYLAALHVIHGQHQA